MRVTVISTGNEIVTGHSRDTNGPYIARTLNTRGYLISRICTVGDVPERLGRELHRATEETDLVILTGGLGPTADDYTRQVVADVVGRGLEQDAHALDHVRRILKHHDVPLDPAHRRQAMFPRGAEVFPNPRGTACGFACSAGEATLVVMPGVPEEMRAMFEDSVLPYLTEGPGDSTQTRKVHLFGVPESEVDRKIADMTERHRNPSVGLTVDKSVVSICLSARAQSSSRAEKLLNKDERELKRRFGGAVFGSDEMTLAGAVAELLDRTDVRLAIAESCTGGAAGSMVVDVVGISQFFLLDVVAYSNAAKINILDVSADEIEEHGAVSPEVAASMAEGVCRQSGAEMGVSTTGIAGPGGGTAEKPVGLVYCGVTLRGESRVHRLDLRGDRQHIKDRAARHALNFARLALLESSDL
ncbi:MAG: competence/damage-inducible protein A [Candidatus Brocadiia bacterium]